jgi:hypothetical protein
MTESRWRLAQLNVGVLRAPVDSPRLAGFVEMLDPINALAERTPGFVWRLQTEDGNATAIRPFEDERIAVNLSVWESLEALGEFVYASSHLDVLRRRREWFERMDEAYLVLWWIPAGTIPTVEEAKRRLEILRERGPSPRAFTFREPFPPPDATEPVRADDRWVCPTG